MITEIGRMKFYPYIRAYWIAFGSLAFEAILGWRSGGPRLLSVYWADRCIACTDLVA